MQSDLGALQIFGIFLNSQSICFALFEVDMNINGIDDQNKDAIFNEPKDLLEENVEDDDDSNNEVVHIYCQL